MHCTELRLDYFFRLLFFLLNLFMFLDAIANLHVIVFTRIVCVC